MEKVIKQLRFRPALPTVVGNVDYERERDLLIRIDELLITGAVSYTHLTLPTSPKV